MRKIRRSKGISPLIATIFLIAFSVTVGLLLSNWIAPMFRGQTDDITDRQDKLTTCSKSKLYFEKNGLTANGSRLTLLAQNTGQNNVTDLIIYITLNDSAFYTIDKATNYNATLLPGQQVLLINTSSINKSNITSAVLSTGPNDQCPSTQWKVEYK